jgi:ubiquinone/menaquinone biosynthesis C-methylase UbiE
VIASEIIEHVFDPSAFVKELFRVVKKGGSLVVTTPYKEKIIYYLCVHCNQKTPANAHIHSFDEMKLEGLYSGNDLESFKYETFGNKVLIFLRSYIILEFFPFWLWKIKDKFQIGFLQTGSYHLFYKEVTTHISHSEEWNDEESEYFVLEILRYAQNDNFNLMF